MDFILRWQSRGVWSDPARAASALESFAFTEADGGRDIGSAATKVADEELRGHLERHARDELRHASLFEGRARELREAHGLVRVEGRTGHGEAAMRHGRSSTEVNAHGFFKQGLLDEMGEVGYVAMLHVAEKKAARLFSIYRDQAVHDPGTATVFADILRDEVYHVAYTKTILERWEAEGRGREIRKAMAATRGGRLWNAWKRTGVRSGAAFSTLLLRILYFTVVAPFGLLARRDTPRAGWQGRVRRQKDPELRSQV